MKLLNQLLLGIVLCSFHFTMAQQATFTEEYTYDKRAVPLELLAQDDNGYYFIFGNGKRGQGHKSIVRYTSELHPTENELTFEDEVKNPKTIGLIPSDDDALIIFREYHNSAKVYKLLHVDPFNMEITNQEVLATIIVDSGFNSIEEFFVDDNGNAQLLYSQPQPNSELQKYSIIGFNSEQQQTGRHDYEMLYTAKQLRLQYGLVSGNKLLLLAAKARTKKAGSDFRRKNYDIVLFEFKDGKVEEKLVIPADDKHLSQLQMLQQDNGDIIIYGFYASRNVAGISGSLFYRINEAGEVITDHAQPLSFQFFIKNLKENQAAIVSKNYTKGDYTSLNFVIQDIVEVDEDFIIIGERNWAFQSYGIWYYQSMDIAAVKINGKTGEIIWDQKIGKNNSNTGNSLYSYFCSVLDGENISFFYNGNEENLDYVNGKAKAAFGNNNDAIMMVNLDVNSGEYYRKVLLNSDEKGPYRIRPSLHFINSENENIIFSQDFSNVKNQRFLKIELDD